jgi:hypothetical protein
MVRSWSAYDSNHGSARLVKLAERIEFSLFTLRWWEKVLVL